MHASHCLEAPAVPSRRAQWTVSEPVDFAGWEICQAGQQQLQLGGQRSRRLHVSASARRRRAMRQSDEGAEDFIRRLCAPEISS